MLIALLRSLGPVSFSKKEINLKTQRDLSVLLFLRNFLSRTLLTGCLCPCVATDRSTVRNFRWSLRSNVCLTDWLAGSRDSFSLFCYSVTRKPTPSVYFSSCSTCRADNDADGLLALLTRISMPNAAVGVSEPGSEQKVPSSFV